MLPTAALENAATDVLRNSRREECARGARIAEFDMGVSYLRARNMEGRSLAGHSRCFGSVTAYASGRLGSKFH
jgi:hypothetical protein